MTVTAFDTLKAAKALQAVGFEERQAEVLVGTVGDALQESQVTRADLEQALRPFITRKDLNEALKEALRPFVTKADLAEVVRPSITQEHSEKALAEQWKRFDESFQRHFRLVATKSDLADFERRITVKFGIMLTAGISLVLAVVGLL